jgi:hypothetical protein
MGLLQGEREVGMMGWQADQYSAFLSQAALVEFCVEQNMMLHLILLQL